MPVSHTLPRAIRNPFAPIFAILVSLSSPAVFAESANPDSTLRLEEVKVQAVRLKKSPDQLPQKIEIIANRDLALTVADDLTDQLKKSSSLDVVQYPGLLSGVGIRGFRPQTGGLNQRTLLLVDGRPAGAANYAAVDLIPVDRIEILKGPFSALYGPQAMGGVINIVPRRSYGKIGNEARLGIGSFGRLEGTFISGGSLTERLNYDLAVHGLAQTRDYRIGREHTLKNLGIVDDDRPTLLPVGAPGKKVDDPDRGDGKIRPSTRYEQQAAALRLGFDINQSWSVDGRVNLYDAPNAENPGDLYYGITQTGLKSVERYDGDAGLRGLIGMHDVKLQTYAAREYSDNFSVKDGYKNFESSLDYAGVLLRDNIAWKNRSLTAGADYQTKSTESLSWKSAAVRNAPTRPDYRISNASIHAQGHLSLLDERLIGTLGTRYDRIIFDVLKTDLLDTYHPGTEEYDVFSSSAGLLYRFNGGFRLRSSVGQGFVTPDGYQVAGYSEALKGSGRIAITTGNPELEPERNVTVDGGVGFEKPASGISMDLTYFHTEVRDRIAARTRSRPALPLEIIDGDTVASRTTFVNADASHMRGIELRFSFDPGVLLGWDRSLRLYANSTRILEAEDETVTPSRDGLRDSLKTTVDIKNVGKANASFGVEYDDRAFLAARLSGRFLGARKDTEFNDPGFPDIRYPGFLLFDATAIFRVRAGTSVSLSLANLLDENYYEKRGFNMPGRNYRMVVSRKF
jgi:outer membrane receptor protein involved in Fe transport